MDKNQFEIRHESGAARAVMMKLFRFAVISVMLWLAAVPAFAQVQRVWLTHRTDNPSQMVVNWQTASPGVSVVRYGLSQNYDKIVSIDENVTLHHVEIPLQQRDTIYHYSVSTGGQTSGDITFKAYPTDELRVAVIANGQSWSGSPPPIANILRDDVHLLLGAGDYIEGLFWDCGNGVKDCTTPFEKWIDQYPSVFRSVPFMPALGNHDRQILLRPGDSQPHPYPVYDIDATAFRNLFVLPGDEWKWSFDIADFGLRFIAPDFNHILDTGNLQSCHAYDASSVQYNWYDALTSGPQPDFVVTVYNERNFDIRRQVNGTWGTMFSRGTIAIAGDGFFAERVEVPGFTYYNTSLYGGGDVYHDPESSILWSQDNYILLTFRKTSQPSMRVEIKNLWSGTVLDSKVYISSGTTPLLAPTATAVASSLPVSLVGQSVTFTATVASASSIPTGMVTFKDGSAVLGTSALNGAGQASYAIAALAAGSHLITAAYGGDENYASSTSAPLTQIVNQGNDFLSPTASQTQSPAANSAGWNNSNVTINWNWADNPGGWGINAAACTSSSVSSGEGAAIVVTATCNDWVGNTGSASYVVKVDKTKPVLNPVVSPNPILLNGSATVISGAADSLSGLASQSCNALVTASAGTKSVTCTAADKAGNTNSATVNYVVLANTKSDVTVQSGQTLSLADATIGGNLSIKGGTVSLNNINVGGSVTMSGGSLVYRGASTVHGNMQISAGLFNLGPGVTVIGDFQIQNLPSGAGQNQVCGATVNGKLTLQHNASPVMLGAASGCSGNKVGGTLQASNNTAALGIFLNSVAGDVQVQSNTDSTMVFSNSIARTLQCSGNAAITGGGNTAQKKQGQCASY